MAKDGYRQLKTSAAQTAANVAGSMAIAVEGGSAEEAITAFNALFDAVFAKLEPVVDNDNALLEAQESASPKATSKSTDPGDTVFTGGKFKGLTIAQVFALSEEQAKAEHGHQYGDGASYITGYAATDKNSNQRTREAAAAFLKTVA